MTEALIISFVVLLILGAWKLFTEPPSDFPGGDGA
jgi:hypothetical protein